MEITKQSFIGVPFRHRYSSSARADLRLVQAIIKYDSQLDLKFYLPTERWHLVRYLSSDRHGKWTRVWELEDRPEVGLRKDPGFWILDALKAGDLLGAAENRVDEVDRLNADVDASNAREAEAQAKDFAADMRVPLQKLYDYGPNADARRLYPVPAMPSETKSETKEDNK